MRKLGRVLSALIISSLLLTSCATAQTPLTEIRDTIANANGTLFTGTVVITWNGGAGPEGATVSPLSTSTKIEHGALTTLLVPSTTGTNASYQAVYNSQDGTALWTETWAVPPSTSPLTVSQVRVATTQGGGNAGNTGNNGNNGTGNTGNNYATLPISITQITNLSTDLNTINSSLTSLTVEVNNLSSIVNSGGSLTGLQNQINVLTTAVTNMSSTVASLSTTVAGQQTSISALNTQLTSVSNSVTGLTNTVNALTTTNTINTAFVDAETPSGLENGTNGSFTLSQAPSPTGSLTLYRNGLIQANGVDFTSAGQSITFISTSIPKIGDILQAFYRVIGSSQNVTFSDSETPSGTINGTNLVFTLAASPTPSSSLKLFKNGVLLQQGGDYTVSGSTIRFMNAAVAPQIGDTLTADYRH